MNNSKEIQGIEAFGKALGNVTLSNLIPTELSVVNRVESNSKRINCVYFPSHPLFHSIHSLLHCIILCEWWPHKLFHSEKESLILKVWKASYVYIFLQFIQASSLLFTLSLRFHRKERNSMNSSSRKLLIHSITRFTQALLYLFSWNSSGVRRRGRRLAQLLFASPSDDQP